MMTVPAFSQRQWVIPAAIKYIDKVCGELAVWLLELELGDHSFPVQLLVREALNNAILHGCQQNEALLVQLEIQVSEADIVVTVQDEGPGFDWQSLLNKTELTETHQTSGRGLWIYKLFASQVEFNPAGSQVRLVRTILPKNDPPDAAEQI